MDENSIDSTEGLLREAEVAEQRGDLQRAEVLCHQVLGLQAENPDALNLIGIIYCRTSRADDGLVFIARACAARPNEASYYNNMGTALSALGRDQDAALTYRRAIELDPGYATAHNNIATVLRTLGSLQESRHHFEQAVRLNPNYAEAFSNMGNALLDLNDVENAAAALEKALVLKPDYAYAHNNLGTVRQRQGRYGDAETCFRRAIELNPKFADPYCNLGEVLKEAGCADGAIPAYRKSLELEPGRASVQSNMLFALNNLNDISPTELLNEHRNWAACHARTFETRHDNDRDPNRRLRVGYVSADFRRHSCAYFFEPLLDGHNTDQVEVTCYANVEAPDQVTERLRTKAHRWCNIFGVKDDDLAARIRDDHIDILVDLSGHTSGNRLGVFGVKPAPVQITWLGYPATSGLDTIDYRLTDALADPVGVTETFYTESLYRLADGFLCYRPPGDAPEVAPPPVLENGYVTFGSCNNLAKVTEQVIEVWARILNNVPRSKLLLKAKAMGDAGVQQRYRDTFAKFGVNPERLDLRSWITGSSHLAVYDLIDIALDSFPFNGTTTTCEAMWSGVPTVVLDGDRHAARVGVSLNSRIGLVDLIAPDIEGYVDLATGLAGDGDELQSFRHGMRERITNSGLLDQQKFSAGVESAFREMWKNWCIGEGGSA